MCELLTDFHLFNRRYFGFSYTVISLIVGLVPILPSRRTLPFFTYKSSAAAAASSSSSSSSVPLLSDAEGGEAAPLPSSIAGDSGSTWSDVQPHALQVRAVGVAALVVAVGLFPLIFFNFQTPFSFQKASKSPPPSGLLRCCCPSRTWRWRGA